MTSEPLRSGAMSAGGATSPEATRTAARSSRSAATGDDLRIRPHNCFACGELNLSGLQLQLHFEPDKCWSETTLASRFEGWEGVAHGGILCTLLDEVMGWSLIDRDSWGVTARLEVQFHHPVEIGQAIRVEGWVTESRRRVQRTAGRVVGIESGVALATAEAVYVAAREDQKARLKERYGYREPLRIARANDPAGERSGRDDR